MPRVEVAKIFSLFSLERIKGEGGGRVGGKAEKQFYNLFFRFWSTLFYFNFDLYVHTLSRAKTAHECLFVATTAVSPSLFLHFYTSGKVAPGD